MMRVGNIMLAEGHMQAMEFPDVVTSSSDYASRFSGATGAWLLDVQAAALKKILGNYPRATVLDVAGGHGQVAAALADSNCKVTVLGSTDACGSRITDLVKSGHCSFSVGNVEKLSYPDNSFDIVTCFRYLAHTENWRNVTTELSRIARKAVVVDFPNINSVNILSPILFKLKNRVEGNTRPFSVLKKSEVDAQFAANGFVDAGSIKQFMLPMAFHRWIKNPRLSELLEGGFKVTGLTGLLGSPVIGHYRSN